LLRTGGSNWAGILIGFVPGTPIEVKCEDGRMIIEKAD
jgi:hypothetical protein